MSLDKCSPEFEKAFSSCGGCTITCVCGRLHYDWANHYDWSDGELEGLKADPDAIGHDYCVEGMEIDGKVFVKDCECGGAVKYENWISCHQEKLARYLNLKSDQMCREANAMKVYGVLAGEPQDEHFERLEQRA